MQTSLRINWLGLATLIVVPATLIAVAILSATITRGDDGVHATAVFRGNIDCEGYVDSADAISLLTAISGSLAAPTNCVDYDGYTSHGCVTPVIPNPTACDVVYPNWVTLAPVEPFPERYDINCDGHVDAGEVLAKLRFSAGLPEAQPTGCGPIGNPDLAG